MKVTAEVSRGGSRSRGVCTVLYQLRPEPSGSDLIFNSAALLQNASALPIADHGYELPV